MKKQFLFAAVFVALTISFSACDQAMNGGGNGDNGNGGGGGGTGTELTPEQTKDKLMNIANGVLNTFNTEDQKAAIRLFDGLYDKYQNYSYDGFEEHYEHRYDEIFRLPQYAKGVLAGTKRSTQIDGAYTFSFAGESAIWEADDANRTWVYKGKASDNSVIFRAKDKNGVMCEAKAWGEGNEKSYSYTWEEKHWEYPKNYVNENALTYGYATGYYNGQYHEFYVNQGLGWYYSDYSSNYSNYYVTYGAIDGASLSYAECYINGNYWSCYYDGYGFYYNDYNNGHEVVDGTRTVTGVLPASIHFSFKQADNEIIRIDFTQEMIKNNHAYFTVDARVVNIRWNADFKINSTNGSFATAFYYGNQSLFSAIAHLPSYKLIDKQDDQTYERWIEEYEERYDELLRKIGSADGMVDINGQAQYRLNVSNFGYAYRDIKKLDDQGVPTNTQDGAQRYCNAINEAQENGLYFNSDVKQADIRMKVMAEERTGWNYDPNTGQETPYTYTSYFMEPVLYFPSDRTTYAFEEYFDRKPFTDLQYSLEDLANAYIRLSDWLYGEVGEIHF